MPHLPEMKWNYEDQLREVTLDNNGGKVYYVYDAGGERVRKVIERNGVKQKERVYLGDTEIFRRYNGTGEFGNDSEAMAGYAQGG